MVVFVDDLDRCLPGKALEVLESMKLFFDLPGFVFVVGIDEEAVGRAIRAKFDIEEGRPAPAEGDRADAAAQVSRRLGQEYVKKIFQLPYTLPVVIPRQLDELLDCIYREAKADSSQFEEWRSKIRLYLDYVTIEGRVNPREIKRFINAYTLQVLINPELKPETVLALQTIAFRHEWESLYGAILTDSALFVDALKRYQGGQDGLAVFADLAPNLEALPPRLASYLHSDLATPLTLHDTLDEYISSVQSVGSTRSWKLEAYSEIGRLRHIIRKTLAKDSIESGIDDITRTADETIYRISELMPSSGGSGDTAGILNTLEQMRSSSVQLSKLAATSFRAPIPQESLSDKITEFRAIADNVYSQLEAFRDDGPFYPDNRER